MKTGEQVRKELVSMNEFLSRIARLAPDLDEKQEQVRQLYAELRSVPDQRPRFVETNETKTRIPIDDIMKNIREGAWDYFLGYRDALLFILDDLY